MTDDILLQLQKDTGCDPALGKLLLKFTGNDIDGVEKILKSVDKDIYIIRGKFIGQSIKVYGSFIILYSGKLKSLEKIVIVIKSEDKSAIEFGFDENWHKYEEELHLFLRKNITEVAAQEKFHNLMKSQRSIIFLDSRFLHKKENFEEDLKNFFTDILATVTGDVDVAVKLKFEKTDIFEINKSKTADIVILEEDDEEEESREEAKKSESDQEQFMLLQIEPELSPIDGTSLSELKKGDLIGVRIVDERPIAEYICSLLKGVDPETHKLRLVFAELKDIKMTEEGIFLNVQFGPGIFGQAYFGEDVKVKVSNKDKVKADELPDNSKDGFLARFFWVLVGLIVISIIVMLIIYLF